MEQQDFAAVEFAALKLVVVGLFHLMAA